MPLAAEAPVAVLFDPMTAETGLAGLRRGEDGESEIYLQLNPGESVIVRTHETVVQGPSFRYYEPTGAPQDLTGTWHLEFTEGGPVRPGDMEVRIDAQHTHLGSGVNMVYVDGPRSGRRCAVDRG